LSHLERASKLELLALELVITILAIVAVAAAQTFPTATVEWAADALLVAVGVGATLTTHADVGLTDLVVIAVSVRAAFGAEPTAVADTAVITVSVARAGCGAHASGLDAGGAVGAIRVRRTLGTNSTEAEVVVVAVVVAHALDAEAVGGVADRRQRVLTAIAVAGAVSGADPGVGVADGGVARAVVVALAPSTGVVVANRVGVRAVGVALALDTSLTVQTDGSRAPTADRVGAGDAAGLADVAERLCCGTIGVHCALAAFVVDAGRRGDATIPGAQTLDALTGVGATQRLARSALAAVGALHTPPAGAADGRVCWAVCVGLTLDTVATGQADVGSSPAVVVGGAGLRALEGTLVANGRSDTAIVVVQAGTAAVVDRVTERSRGWAVVGGETLDTIHPGGVAQRAIPWAAEREPAGARGAVQDRRVARGASLVPTPGDHGKA